MSAYDDWMATQPEVLWCPENSKDTTDYGWHTSIVTAAPADEDRLWQMLDREPVAKFNEWEHPRRDGRFTAGEKDDLKKAGVIVGGALLTREIHNPAATRFATKAGARLSEQTGPVERRVVEGITDAGKDVPISKETHPEGIYNVSMDSLTKYRSMYSSDPKAKAAMGDLKSAIKKDGFTHPVHVKAYDDKAVLWDGNHRLTLADDLKIKDVPVSIVHMTGKAPNDRTMLGAINHWRQKKYRQELVARRESVGVSKAFNPLQVRNALGQWSRMGGTAVKDSSKGERMALEPAQVAAIPGMTKLDLEHQIAIVHAYSFKHGGMSSKITGVDKWHDGRIQVSGAVTTDKGEHAGMFIRRMNPESGLVEHTGFVLEEGYQGSGFGAHFLQQQMETYKAFGYKKVEVHADIDVGGYTWAQTGYKFRNVHAETDFLDRLYKYSGGAKRMTEEEGMKLFEADPFGYMSNPELKQAVLVKAPEFEPSPDALGVLRQMHDAIKRGEDVTPQDFARVGLSEAKDVTVNGVKTKMWAGKQFLLNSEWHGVFTL